MKITTGLGGSAQNTVMYSSVEPMKQNQKVNDFAGVVPVLSPKQTTEYREKKTGDLLASYTQTGEISGDLYTIAGVAKFERYELIESPQPTEGALGSSYAVGSTFITHWLGYREASAKVVVDNNGSLRFIQFVINPDHPNFKQNYERTDTPSADELQIPLIMSLLKDDSLTGEEKYAKINRPDAPYLTTFVSEVTAPGEFNSQNDAFTGGTSWSYKTTKKWATDGQGLTDTFAVELGAYSVYPKTNLRPASKPTDSDKRDVETTLEENGQIKQDTVLEVTYVYELAGSVNVNYIDENGNVIKDPVPDVENGKPGDPYDTDSDNKPNRITTSDGKTYEFKEVFKDSEPTTGEVEGGKTKEITYVYREITPDPETPVVTSEDKPKTEKVVVGTEKRATIAPRTGDSAGAFAFAGLLALSAMGLAFSLYRTRFGK